VKNPLMLAAGAATLALLAGCGSSSSKTPSSTNAAASTPAATTSATTPTAAATPGVTISAKHSKLGTILSAGPKHMTVYLFEADKSGQSACSGACAQAWPPVTSAGEPQAAGQASQSDLSTITRTDGTKQVTYKGHPLYFFVKDGDAGDAYGEGVKAFGADWYVLSPSGGKIDNS
jgi:predicted lipoprotein with Yx(FWY)xxD motif